MSTQHRFLISFIQDNQPKTIEAHCDSETMSLVEAEATIRAQLQNPNSTVTDIQVMGLHRPNNPHVHPGHYQQPEE
jgi:hypothetical protein